MRPARAAALLAAPAAGLLRPLSPGLRSPLPAGPRASPRSARLAAQAGLDRPADRRHQRQSCRGAAGAAEAAAAAATRARSHRQTACTLHTSAHSVSRCGPEHATCAARALVHAACDALRCRHGPPSGMQLWVHAASSTCANRLRVNRGSGIGLWLNLYAPTVANLLGRPTRPLAARLPCRRRRARPEPGSAGESGRRERAKRSPAAPARRRRQHASPGRRRPALHAKVSVRVLR